MRKVQGKDQEEQPEVIKKIAENGKINVELVVDREKKNK